MSLPLKQLIGIGATGSSSGNILSVFLQVSGCDIPALAKTFAKIESNLISLSKDFNIRDSSAISIFLKEEDEHDDGNGEDDDRHAEGCLLSSWHFGSDELLFPILQ